MNHGYAQVLRLEPGSSPFDRFRKGANSCRATATTSRTRLRCRTRRELPTGLDGERFESSAASAVLDVRGRRLRAALAAVVVRAHAPELAPAHRWLDTWTVVGLITGGVERQGLRLSLTYITEGEWRAQFMGEPALLAPRGYGVAASPWHAVQLAAWAPVRHADRA